MKTAHEGLHSEQGARSGEHPGRSRNPLIKVHDIAWLEFEKPDLTMAEAFAHAFGFATLLRTDTELQLRGTDPGTPCLIIRRGASTRFRGMAFEVTIVDALPITAVGKPYKLPLRADATRRAVQDALADAAGVDKVDATTHDGSVAVAVTLDSSADASTVRAALDRYTIAYDIKGQ
jgi:hypothetical protein